MTIYRKTTTFQGGDITIKSGQRTGSTYASEQPVEIIRAVPDAGEDEDRYAVLFYNLGTAIVDGCDLHPHPEARPTNVEFITNLMDNAQTALTQAFVIEGAAKYAEAIAAAKPEDCGNALIHGGAWQRVGIEVGEAIKAHYKS